MATSPKNNPSLGKANQGETSQANDAANDPLEHLKQQHKELKTLLVRNGEAGFEHMDLVREIARLWVPHTIIEEEILYPAVREKISDQSAIREAQVRRDVVKILLRDLLRDEADADFFEAKLSVLRAELGALMKLEEKPTHGLLALAAANGVDLESLRPRVAKARDQFKRDAEEDTMHPPAPRSLRLFGAGSSKERESMQRQQTMPERDEQGRFMSEDDRGGRSGSRGSYRDRDDDDRGRGSQSRSSRDDERSSGRGGHGGWFGDSEGHSEAARRGWEEREGGSRGEYSRSRSSNDDERDRMSSGRGHGGWFGDPEGHSEASRRGWEEREGGSRGNYSRGRSSYDDDSDRSSGRGHGGWFGDPEGHSEASRRGWEEREGSSRGNYSRGRSSYGDDRNRMSSGRGQSGWYGDSERHSEASRRGWDERDNQRGYDEDNRSSRGGRYDDDRRR